MSLVMVHPDVDAPAEVVDEGKFEKVWANRGWTLLDEPCAYATRLLGKKVTEVGDLKADEVERLAKSRRVTLGKNKADNQAAYLDSFQEPEPDEEPAPAPEQPVVDPTPPAPSPADIAKSKAPAADDKNKETHK